MNLLPSFSNLSLVPFNNCRMSSEMHRTSPKTALTPSEGSPVSMNRRRSRRGCLICRRKKIKCDERTPACYNCSRSSISCAWDHRSSDKQKSRSNKACLRCRARKIKCHSSGQSQICAPCLEAESDCTRATQGDIQSINTASDHERPAASGKPTSELLLPEKGTLRQLLCAFFDGPYHYCFYAFLHAPTFMQMFDSGRLPESLLLITAATSLRMMEPQSPSPDRWADECRRRTMLEAFEPPTQSTLQTLILLQRYEWHRGSHISAWIISAIAVRLTHALQLNLELLENEHGGRSVSIIVREMRRRTLWGCFVMESLMEGGRNPFSGLDLSSIEVRLPCDERSFRLGVDSYPTSLLEPDAPRATFLSELPNIHERPNISAYLVRLAVLRMLIIQYTAPYHPSNLGRMPQNAPWQDGSSFYKFEAELASWSASLAEDLRFNIEVLYRRQPNVIGLITFHCMFQGCYCDLYRIGSYLTASNQKSECPFLDVPDSFLQYCRNGRLQHATTIAQIIKTGIQYLRVEHDPFIAISACLAIRILVIERRAEDSSTFDCSDESIHALLLPAFTSAKKTAQWSVPIRRLLRAICEHAERSGCDFDLSDIPQLTSLTSRPQSRPTSPSLRTHGTFGSIQTSLYKNHDALTPAVSSHDQEQSDLFADRTAIAQKSSRRATLDDTSELGFEKQPNNASILWPDWTNTSLDLWNDPLQLAWADHSLGIDQDHDWTLGLM